MELPTLPEVEKQRRKLGLTQTQLAQKSGVSQSLIARIESGTVDPRYGNLVKIFTALENLKDEKEKTKGVKAKDIMTRRVVEADASGTIEAVADKMKRYGVSQVPVVDGGVMVGSISERDVFDQIARGVKASEFSKNPVRAYMRDSFPTVSPETPLSAISTLLEHSTAVVVQEKGKTRGIITNANLLKMVHE